MSFPYYGVAGRFDQGRCHDPPCRDCSFNASSAVVSVSSRRLPKKSPMFQFATWERLAAHSPLPTRRPTTFPHLRRLTPRSRWLRRSGPRTIPIREFIVDWYTTVLDADRHHHWRCAPRRRMGSVGVFEKLERTAGDFAIASVALILAMDDGVLQCGTDRYRCLCCCASAPT